MPESSCIISFLASPFSISFPWLPAIRSSPLPPLTVSAQLHPFITSFPSPTLMVSASELPIKISSPFVLIVILSVLLLLTHELSGGGVEAAVIYHVNETEGP
ncbi:MAG TPA: hypothetical protein VH796_09195 [Nitrososphaeraceae archaeon]